MTQEFVNWSGSLRFVPGTIAYPADEREAAEIVRRAADSGRTVRVVAAGHSSSPLVETDDVLVCTDKLQGVVSVDPVRSQATIRTGMSLDKTGKVLLDQGLAMHNLGDVDVQTVAGAIATGTHGSGKTLQNLAVALVGVRMVNASGEIVEYDIERDPDFFCAARVSLGALGIFTEIRLQMLPAYQLRRQEWCTDVDRCLAHLDELLENNRNFDFYWYPRSDEVKLRTLNPPDQAPDSLPYAVNVEDRTDWAMAIISKTRELKFDEMEYAVPAEAGVACFQEVRQRVKERHRRGVGWRVLYRYVKQDDAYLSTAHGYDIVTISVHQNNTLPFWEYFKDMEPIFRAYGGRPHWAKKHTMRAPDIRPLYPKLDRFLDVRRALDPDGRFYNSYLRDLLEG